MSENVKYNITSVATCHIGKVRTNNEDNLFFNDTYLPMEHTGISGNQQMKFQTDTPKVVAIFDGMGGESSGELASYTAVREFSEQLNLGSVGKDYLSILLNDINRKLCETSKEERIRQMGTTMSAIFFRENKAIVSNVGDSPVLMIRNGEIQRVFEAHTNEAMLKANNIKRKPALTQFLGLDQDGVILEPYYEEISILPGDIFIVASDGLTDMVKEDEILEIVNTQEDIQNRLSRLLNTALENGGVDNTTIILSQVEAIDEKEGTSEKEHKIQKGGKKYPLLTMIILCVLAGAAMFGVGYVSGKKSEASKAKKVQRKELPEASTRNVKMPKVINETWQDGIEKLNKKNIRYKIKFKDVNKEKKEDDVASGTSIYDELSDVILSQSVKEGAYIKDKEIVTLVIGRGNCGENER